MRRTGFLATGLAAFALGCGGDTAPKATGTKPPPSPAATTNAPVVTPSKPVGERPKLPPIDVPEPPPPKGVSDKPKSSTPNASSSDEPKAPPPVDKPGANPKPPAPTDK